MIDLLNHIWSIDGVRIGLIPVGELFKELKPRCEITIARIKNVMSITKSMRHIK